MSESLFEIVVYRGDSEVSRHQLGPGEYFAGTAAGCAVPIPLDVPGRKFTRISVSRDGRVSLEDLESENGTMLDDLPIVLANWQPGHLVRFGEVRLELWPVVEERVLPAVASPQAAASLTASTPEITDAAPTSPRAEEALLQDADRPPREMGARPVPVVAAARAKSRAAAAEGRPRMRLVLLLLALLAAAGGGAYWRLQHESANPAGGAGDNSNLALTFYHQATALVEEGRYEEALRKVAPALEIDPDAAEYHYLRGNILESLFRLSEAEESYNEALARNPNHLFAQQNRDLCTLLVREAPEGISSSASARQRLGRLMSDQGRSREAKTMSNP